MNLHILCILVKSQILKYLFENFPKLLLGAKFCTFATYYLMLYLSAIASMLPDSWRKNKNKPY